MLDLNAPVRTELGVDLGADSVDPGLFHAFPAPPRVRRVADRPEVELLRFVSDVDGTGPRLTGGHLRLSVDLGHPDGLLDEIAARLSADPARRGEPVRVSPVAVQQATTQLLFIGQEPNDQGGLSALLTRALGETSAGVEAPHTATLTAELTPDGVRMLEAALSSGGAPIAVVSRLRVEGLWPAQRVLATVDWGRVYDHVSSHLKVGRLLEVDDISRVVEELREDRSIVISAVQSLTPETGGGPGDLAAATAWVQRELVERFCEPVLPLNRAPAHVGLGTVGEIFGVGTRFAAKHSTQIERAVATVDFQRSAVLVRHYSVQAHLADVLGPADASAYVVDAGLDHPFFQRFAIRVRSAAPLPSLHLDEVVGELAYGSTHLPVRLTADEAGAEARLEAWADASPDRTWVLQASARFALDAPLDPGQQVPLPEQRGRSRELTLDLEQLLGLTPVTLTLTPDPRVLLTRATLRHWRGAEQRAEHDLVLTAEAAQTTVWFRDRRPGDRIGAEVSHLLTDGRAVPQVAFDVDSTQVVLPVAFPPGLTVQLIASDHWAEDGVQSVAVALQRHLDAPALTVVLSGPGERATVSLELPDPVERGYRYRTTTTLAGGGVREDDWVASDRSVLLVGGQAGNLLVVDLTPVGAELPTAGVLLIEAELSYLDTTNLVRDQRKVVIRALADRPRWEVPIADPTRRTYEYRLTVHRTSGQVSVGPWLSSSDRMLVVPVTREL